MAAFCQGDATAIFHDLLEDIAQADLTVVDLECPLTDRETPIAKCGPNLTTPWRASGQCERPASTCSTWRITIFSITARAGLENTLAAAAAAGIATVGAGRNLNEARRILIRNLQGIRVGILALAQHEFSIATSASAGANPLDLIDVTRNIAAEREKFDYW